jgi:hypothetical protein
VAANSAGLNRLIGSRARAALVERDEVAVRVGQDRVEAAREDDAALAGSAVSATSGGCVGRRDRIRAASMPIVPGTSPVRSSGTPKRKQRTPGRPRNAARGPPAPALAPPPAGRAG